MNSVTPYIYKLTFKPDGRVYIGARFNKKGCNPSEFWVEGGYFTSSKAIKSLIKSHGTALDIWEVDILEVFPTGFDLKQVPKRENEYILEYVNANGFSSVLNRKWTKTDGETVYSNAGMTYTCKGISDKALGMVVAKDLDGNMVKVTKEEFNSRSDLVGTGSGCKFYHNPVTGHRIKIKLEELPPEGYVAGLGSTSTPEQRENISKLRKSSIHISNGKISKIWPKDQPIPEGWSKGRIIKEYDRSWTPERTVKFKNTFAKKVSKGDHLQ